MSTNARPRSAVPVQGAFAPPSSPSPVMDTLLGAAGAQVSPPAPAAAVPTEAAVEVRPQTAPAKRRTPARKVATQAREVSVPPPPKRAYPGTTSLNVRVRDANHWALKMTTSMRGEKMTRVVGALIDAFLDAPDDWLALIDEVEMSQKTLGQVLTPLVLEALEQLQEE